MFKLLFFQLFTLASFYVSLEKCKSTHHHPINENQVFQNTTSSTKIYLIGQNLDSFSTILKQETFDLFSKKSSTSHEYHILECRNLFEMVHSIDTINSSIDTIHIFIFGQVWPGIEVPNCEDFNQKKISPIAKRKVNRLKTICNTNIRPNTEINVHVLGIFDADFLVEVFQNIFKCGQIEPKIHISNQNLLIENGKITSSHIYYVTTEEKLEDMVSLSAKLTQKYPSVAINWTLALQNKTDSLTRLRTFPYSFPIRLEYNFALENDQSASLLTTESYVEQWMSNQSEVMYELNLLGLKPEQFYWDIMEYPQGFRVTGVVHVIAILVPDYPI